MEKLELVAAGGISPVRTDPDLVFLKEPYSPSYVIWMHSNNHSKQWSLFSRMCLKEPHPFPSHIRIHTCSNNHYKQWSLFSTMCLKKNPKRSQSYEKATLSTEMSNRQRDNKIKTPPKGYITQRLWTDLGQSVGVAKPPLVIKCVYKC